MNRQWINCASDTECIRVSMIDIDPPTRAGLLRTGESGSTLRVGSTTSVQFQNTGHELSPLLNPQVQQRVT